MREKLQNIVSAVFSVFTLIAILGGGVVFLMFVLSLVIGGETGEFIALSARKTVMPYFIRSATVGTLAGLISFYTTGLHALSIEKKIKK